MKNPEPSLAGVLLLQVSESVLLPAVRILAGVRIVAPDGTRIFVIEGVMNERIRDFRGQVELLDVVAGCRVPIDVGDFDERSHVG